MASPTPEIPGTKRKRSPDDSITRPAASGPAHPSPSKINYLLKIKTAPFKLIEGDAETFADVLGMIDDYEGVLQRQESLAANLGAKLVGPLLLKSFEKLFDGPIKVVQSSYQLEQSSVTWLDIVTFARTNLSDFVLTDTNHGKVCRVWIQGGQLEIPEDDYRLIMSGAPERMIPSQATPEDEAAELGTLNILETRLAMLIKKADAVASKARQLNYHLKGRKAAVQARKTDLATTTSESSTENRTFSPQPFSAINRTPKPVNGELAKIQQELLEQFMANGRRGSVAHTPRPKGSRGTTADHGFNGDSDSRRLSHPISSDDGLESHYRVIMAGKIEKLARGDVITPPCDRCRRLRFDCTKHLTACSACTKKHAKCSWKDIKEGELDENPTPAHPVSAGENGYGIGKIENIASGIHHAQEPLGHDRSSSGLAVSDTDPMQELIEASEGRMEEDTPNDLAILTQIASAAAAAGS